MNRMREREYQRKYRKEHKENVRKYNEKYRKEHREDVRKYYKKYGKEHREDIKRYREKYKKEHREDIRKYNEKYRGEHRVEILERRRLKRRSMGIRPQIVHPFHNLWAENKNEYYRLFYKRYNKFMRKFRRGLRFSNRHGLPKPHYRRETWADGRTPLVGRFFNGRFTTLEY